MLLKPTIKKLRDLDILDIYQPECDLVFVVNGIEHAASIHYPKQATGGPIKFVIELKNTTENQV